MTGVLDGITVLQLPSGIAGAMAGMLLADNGADVITVEGGDHGPIWCRTVWDRGKRSIVADDDQVRALADGVDVVIESQGLDHATLAATNPRLILCSITGYGRGNRHAGRPNVDALVAARMGMHWDQRGVVDGQPVRIARLPLPDPGPVPPGAEQTGNRDGPIFQALPWNSIGACLLAVTGISAALRAREVTGAGQWVETSLLQGGLLNAAPTWQRVPNPRQDGYRLPYFDRRCPKGFFRCADGRWLHQWAPIHHAFAQAAAAGPELRRPDPAELPPPARPSGYDAQLAAELAEHPRTAAAFAKFGRDEWVRLFAAAGVAGPTGAIARGRSARPVLARRRLRGRGARSRRGADPPGRARLPDVAHTGAGGPTGAPPGPAHHRGPGPTTGRPALPARGASLGPRPGGRHRARPRPGHGRALRRADPR